MQYMIIEKFFDGRAKDIYQRFEEKGRMLPNGVTYISSWIDENVSICFQLMEAESRELLQQWIDCWSDLANFEVVRVINSAEAKARALG